MCENDDLDKLHEIKEKGQKAGHVVCDYSDKIGLRAELSETRETTW
jgi:hypothetical protein